MTDEQQAQSNDDEEHTAPVQPIMPDSDVGSTALDELVDSDAGDAVPEPAMEMPDPAPEGPRYGVLDDESDEHPIPLGDGPVSKLQQAYECLQIKTPVQEYRTYASARLEALVRLGDTERAEVTSRALEVGTQALRQAMGALPREAP